MTYKQLLKYYQDKVDSIPEMRYCIMYQEEIAVKILPFLNENFTKSEEDDKILIIECIKLLRGQANPAFILQLINEWRETENE